MGAEFVLVVIAAGDSPNDSRIARHFGELGRRVDGHTAFIGAVEAIGCNQSLRLARRRGWEGSA